MCAHAEMYEVNDISLPNDIPAQSSLHESVSKRFVARGGSGIITSIE